MSNFDWSDFDQPSDYPDPFKFETVGDSIAGTIQRIDTVTNENGTTPVMDIKPDDGDARTVWISQTRLQRRMAELRPQKDDKVAIVYSGDGHPSKPGYSPPKLFDVKLVQANTDGPVLEREDPTGTTSQPATVSADSLI